ncbi:hypothetical protein QZH41_003494 [Actinostola sp. cb2023]|nr:hypothetical protein QZH41_003494 [Actinostola sp. cb2023]
MIVSLVSIAPSRRASLYLQVGDEIEILNQSDPEWWEGKSMASGNVGYFPRSHVVSKDEADLNRKKTEELVEYYRDNTLGVSFPGLDTTLRCGINEQVGEQGIGWAKALYAYTARNSKEISIQKNCKILILNKDGDWWKGECDGQVNDSLCLVMNVIVRLGIFRRTMLKN